VRIWRSDLGSEQEPDVALEGEDAITSIATSVSNQLCYWHATNSWPCCLERTNVGFRGALMRAFELTMRMDQSWKAW
jgi:hypothetical protein